MRTAKKFMISTPGGVWHFLVALSKATGRARSTLLLDALKIAWERELAHFLKTGQLPKSSRIPKARPTPPER